MTDAIITDFHDAILDSLESVKSLAKIERFWLGGGPGPSGGQGVRPGGFIGELIQRLVAYDTTEAATLSGQDNLVDNLNHIRYRVSQLETGGVGGGSSTNLAIARWSTVSGVSQLELPDYAYQILDLTLNGLTVDPLTYSLIEYSVIELDNITPSGAVLTAQYSILMD